MWGRPVALVGPACAKSGLRALRLIKPKNETPLQRRLRIQRRAVHEWNQKFWANHNERFRSEKEAFRASLPSTASPDEMSVFYKSFLDRNWSTHVNYNLDWYRKNVSLMLLSYRVSLDNIWNKIKPSR